MFNVFTFTEINPKPILTAMLHTMADVSRWIHDVKAIDPTLCFKTVPTKGNQ